MPVIRFPSLMKYYVEGQLEVRIEGATVKDLIENLLLRYPALKSHLFDPQGGLRRYFNIFVNGTHIRDLDGFDTPLKPTDKIILMASAAGG